VHFITILTQVWS